MSIFNTLRQSAILLLAGVTLTLSSCNSPSAPIETPQEDSMNKALLVASLKLEESVRTHRNDMELFLLRSVDNINDEDAAALLAEHRPFVQDVFNAVGFSSEDVLRLELEYGSNAMFEGAFILSSLYVAFVQSSCVDTQLRYADKKTELTYLDKTVNCLGSALGADILQAVLGELGEASWKQALKKIGKKGLKKIVGKAASRLLGPIGAVILVYEFGDCMLSN